MDMVTKPPAAAADKYGPDITLLRDDAEHLRRHPAPAYWALMPHYVRQITENACSLASATMVVNAARQRIARAAGVRHLSQQDMLAAVADPAWHAGVIPEDGRGATVRELGGLLGRTLAAYGFGAAEITTVELVEGGDGALGRFRAALRAMEDGPGRFIVANFHMAAVMGAGDYGHFSPLGAYDAIRDRALVLDVYRQDFEPYWVPVERLFAAMATAQASTGDPRGYLTVRLTD
ncbi:MAG: phytochelatin synthase family protein [Dongiaceae bacterium]